MDILILAKDTSKKIETHLKYHMLPFSAMDEALTYVHNHNTIRSSDKKNSK